MKKVLNISVIVLLVSFTVGHLAYANQHLYGQVASMSGKNYNHRQIHSGYDDYDSCSESDSDSESDSQPIKVSLFSCMWSSKPKSTGEIKAKKVEVSNRKSKSFQERWVELKNSLSDSKSSSGSARSSQEE